MSQVEYSIEFGHIFTDQKFGEEQQKSIETAVKRIRKLGSGSYKTIVLIDDYNPERSSLDIQAYLSKLDQEGLNPNYWAFESNLVPHATEYLARIRDRALRASYERYVKQKNVVPCSLLTAIWYSIRLGQTQPNTKLFTPYEFQPGNRLINILPTKYRESEEKTLKLLRATNEVNAGQIETVYFETREESSYRQPL